MTPEILMVLNDDELRELGVVSIGGRLRLRALARAMVEGDERYAA